MGQNLDFPVWPQPWADPTPPNPTAAISGCHPHFLLYSSTETVLGWRPLGSPAEGRCSLFSSPDMCVFFGNSNDDYSPCFFSETTG